MACLRLARLVGVLLLVEATPGAILPRPGVMTDHSGTGNEANVLRTQVLQSLHAGSSSAQRQRNGGKFSITKGNIRQDIYKDGKPTRPKTSSLENTEFRKMRPKRSLTFKYGTAYHNFNKYEEVDQSIIQGLLKQHRRKKRRSRSSSSRSWSSSSRSRTSSRRSRTRRFRRSRTWSRGSHSSDVSGKNYSPRSSYSSDSSASRHRHVGFKKILMQRKLRKSPRAKALYSGLVQLRKSTPSIFRWRPQVKILFNALHDVFDGDLADYSFAGQTDTSEIHGVHHDNHLQFGADFDSSESASSSISSESLASDEVIYEPLDDDRVKNSTPTSPSPPTVHTTTNRSMTTKSTTQPPSRSSSTMKIQTSTSMVSPTNSMIVPITVPDTTTPGLFTHSPVTTPVSHQQSTTINTTPCPVTHTQEMTSEQSTTLPTLLTYLLKHTGHTTTHEVSYDFEPIIQSFEVVVDQRLFKDGADLRLSDTYPHSKTTLRPFHLTKPWYHKLLSPDKPESDHPKRYVTITKPSVHDRIITDPPTGLLIPPIAKPLIQIPHRTAQEKYQSQTVTITSPPTASPLVEQMAPTTTQKLDHSGFTARFLPNRAESLNSNDNKATNKQAVVTRLLPANEKFMKNIPRLLPVNDAWRKTNPEVLHVSEIAPPGTREEDQENENWSHYAAKKETSVPSEIMMGLPRYGVALKYLMAGIMTSLFGFTDQSSQLDTSDIGRKALPEFGKRDRTYLPQNHKAVLDRMNDVSAGNAINLNSKQHTLISHSNPEGFMPEAKQWLSGKYGHGNTNMKLDDSEKLGRYEGGNVRVHRHASMLSGSAFPKSNTFASDGVGESLNDPRGTGVVATGVKVRREHNKNTAHAAGDFLRRLSQGLVRYHHGKGTAQRKQYYVTKPPDNMMTFGMVDSAFNQMSRLHELHRATIVMGQYTLHTLSGVTMPTFREASTKVKENNGFGNTAMSNTVKPVRSTDRVLTGRWEDWTNKGPDNDAPMTTKSEVVRSTATRWKHTKQPTTIQPETSPHPTTAARKMTYKVSSALMGNEKGSYIRQASFLIGQHLLLNNAGLGELPSFRQRKTRTGP